MAVWHDRYDGVFPSWLTAVEGKGNCTTAAHSRTGFVSRQPIQWRCLQYAATEAGAAAHNRFTPGPPGRETCVWMPGIRTKLSPGSCHIRAAPGENGWYLNEKKAIMRAKGGVVGCPEGKQPLFAHSEADLSGISQENSR